ncbi:DENN domain-containing protein [Oopsacas minuta]|uniref:DENN domain-containing protein n=1 Tax=Oopsacas minuta TaxID=111878 RepID=A0AAV7JUL0_9METZ|nr:DENN domain-containing protein [Oopsacas minuta]
MLSQENLLCLAPFSSMTHKYNNALQPNHQQQLQSPAIVPQTLTESPKLPRPPPKPKPHRFVLKSTDPVPSELTPTPLKSYPHRNSFLDSKESAFGFETQIYTENKFSKPQVKNIRDFSKHVDYHLEVRSTKPELNTCSSLSLSIPSPTQDPQLNTANLPIQELNASPYSVKKKFKIGKHKRRYTPNNSPILGKESNAEPSLTSFNRSQEDAPNNLVQSQSIPSIKGNKKDKSIAPAPVLKSIHSVPIDDLGPQIVSRPSLLKSYSDMPGDSPDGIPTGMHTSPSFDSSDPSVADIGSLKLVTRLFSQFESVYDQSPRRPDNPSLPRLDSFLQDFILVDKQSDNPNAPSSATELDHLKKKLKKVYSTDDITNVGDDFTTSSATSVFIDPSRSIPSTPSVVMPKRRAWDQVNSAFSLIKLRGSVSHTKRSDPSYTPSISGSEEDDDQGGKILLRSKRPAHEIFRESIRVKKRERLMIASMSNDKTNTSPSSSATTLESERSEQKMFEYVIVVGLSKSKTEDKYEPTISYRFPPMNDMGAGSFLSSVPQFCFPDASLWKPAVFKPSHNHLSETYSFVLTDELGVKKFGYCRRILPKGKDLPEVYCIISPLGCFSLYSSILDYVETERARSSALVYAFLRAVISRPLPLPGQSVSIKSIVSDSRQGVGGLSLFRPQESSRLEHVNFSKLMCCLGIKLTLQLFAATLLERRIIFVAEQLSLLSSCCHAIVALLYPFSWQHVFVPILPEAMVHICCSPSPYIVGLLPSSLETVLQFGEEMEEAIIISLDDRKFIRKAGDEDQILPSKLQTALLSLLTGCDKPNTWREDLEMSDVVIEAFIRFFIEILDIYKDFTYPNLDDPSIIEFQTKPFLKTIKSKASRRFMSEFCKTQMFFNFLQEQGDNPEFSQSIKTMFQERYDEIMSNRVLSAKYGKHVSSGLLKKFRFGKIASSAPGKSK